MNLSIVANQLGIHSAPLVPWDGEGRPDPEPVPPGFCSHNIITFPTWHRPYMLLYEVGLQLLRSSRQSDHSVASPLRDHG